MAMLNARRVVAAMTVGALGCLFIWLATPYNNFYLSNSFISDTYFPVAGVIFMLAFVLGVNPLLHLIRRQWVFNRRQLALVFVMLLAAAVIPSQGLLRMLPWSIARSNQEINLTEPLANAIERSRVPKSLFPDQVGYLAPTPTSDQFLDELDEGASIPWGAWLRILPIWGVFLLSCWLLMVGVGLVLFPEWRDKERLPFPLLDVYRSLLPDARAGTILPTVFRERLFWLGAVAVIFLYALVGLNHHTHGRVPAIPLGWNLSPVFTEVPWRYLPGPIKNVEHIYFVLVGMAFFMPNRVSFSIWFTTVAYGVYGMVNRAYFPTGYFGGAVHDHRNGAMIAVAVMTLYLSRHHWLRVGRLMLSRVRDDADRLLKMSGWMLLAGMIGMFAWLVWAGVPYILAVVFVFIAFMVSLLIARIVAETGLPFVRITGLEPLYFMAMMPAGWLTGAAIYISGFVNMLFPLGSRISAAVLASHAAGVDEKADAKQQLRTGYLMIAILVVGLVVCGAVHLHMGYTHAQSLDVGHQPINTWGSQVLSGTHGSLIRWSQGSWITPSRRLGNLLVGIVIAGGLQVMCMLSPGWPVHPIGMLLVGHYYSDTAWASIFIGWALKMVLVYYGGAAAYKRAKPLFLGIILGEIISAVIWTLVPVALLWWGMDPSQVGHIQVLPT
ncbi:MAG: hypothetical protein GC164_08690 [Phycisphaera sp.]|nr:hypothetical protein [Phycisphaera sp.]